MNMKTTRYLVLAALALSVAACNNDEVPQAASGLQEARISAGLDGVLTRANGSQWEEDHIGVYVTDDSGSGMVGTFSNVEYQTSASNASGQTSFSPVGGGIFFQDATANVTFAAYGPYKPYDKIAADYTVSANTTEQSSRTAQQAFDFIYSGGVTASHRQPTVMFNFAHKMSRLVLVMKTSDTDGFSATEVQNGVYTLTGIQHKGTFNVVSGQAKANLVNLSDPESSTMGTAWRLNDHSIMQVADDRTSVTFTSILFPQAAPDGISLKAEIGGQVYEAMLAPALEQGYSYQYTVTMKKQGLEVSGCTIADWADGGTSDITARIPVVYNLAEMANGSVITINDGCEAIVNGSAAAAEGRDVAISINGNARLTLNNVYLKGANSCIQVNSGTATIVLVGENKMESTGENDIYPVSLTSSSANVVIDGKGRTGSLSMTNYGKYIDSGVYLGCTSAMIGGRENQGCGDITIKGAKIEIVRGQISAYADADGNGAAFIGSGNGYNGGTASCGDITISGSDLSFRLGMRYIYGALIGSGASYSGSSAAGDIDVSDSRITVEYNAATTVVMGPYIGCGEAGSYAVNICDNINVRNTEISSSATAADITTRSALIGVGAVFNDGTASCGTITVSSGLDEDAFVRRMNGDGLIVRDQPERFETDWIGLGQVKTWVEADTRTKATRGTYTYRCTTADDERVSGATTKYGVKI